MRTARAIIGLTLVGCSVQHEEPFVAPRTFVGGARLRARVQLADGGARRFVGFHDAMLDIDCAIAPAGDGVDRCYPPNAPANERSKFAPFTTREVELVGIKASIATSADGAAAVRHLQLAGSATDCAIGTLETIFRNRALDTSRRVACYPTDVADPEDLSLLHPFLDAACSMPAVAWWGHARRPTLSLEVPPGACSHLGLRVLGEIVPRVYSMRDAACSVGTTMEGAALKGPVDLVRFPSVERMDAGTGRLKVVRFGSRGVVIAELGFVDNGVACSPEKFADGTLRCFPTQLSTFIGPGLNRFADSKCAQMLVPAFAPETCPLVDTRYVTTRAREGFTAVYRMADKPYAGPVFAVGDSGCGELLPSYNGEYRTVEYLPFETFAEVHEVLE